MVLVEMVFLLVRGVPAVGTPFPGILESAKVRHQKRCWGAPGGRDAEDGGNEARTRYPDRRVARRSDAETPSAALIFPDKGT